METIEMGKDESAAKKGKNRILEVNPLLY